MSIQIETILFCDVCSKNNSGDDRNKSAKEIRKTRKLDGWVNKGKNDYCKECWEELKKK